MRFFILHPLYMLQSKNENTAHENATNNAQWDNTNTTLGNIKNTAHQNVANTVLGNWRMLHI